MEIAKQLNASVQSVAVAAQESEGKAQSIGKFIAKQNESLRSTNDAVAKLIDSVETVTGEVKVETDVVNATVDETKMMIEGVGKAAVGVQPPYHHPHAGQCLLPLYFHHNQYSVLRPYRPHNRNMVLSP